MIRAEGIGKRYDGAWVFRGASFEVPAGSAWVLLGRSGTGKSTLLKILAGLERADEGRVSIGTREIGMLFQRGALFDSFTVAENLKMPLRERLGVEGAEADRRVTRWLEAVGLRGIEALLPDELSGGMQKRLGIARTLIVEPELILYDEPTAGLDPITSRAISELIHQLRRERGTTTVIVTNDMARAYQLGDRIALLWQGELIDAGNPEETRRSSRPEVRQFVTGLLEAPRK
jgi:phospholipid/cholesterol/gamma-HCH transport system ATP-binding protein